MSEIVERRTGSTDRRASTPDPVNPGPTPVLNGPTPVLAGPNVNALLPVLGAELVSPDLFDVDAIAADAPLRTRLRERRGGDLSGLRFRLIRIPLSALSPSDGSAIRTPDDFLMGDKPNEVAYQAVVKLTDAYRSKAVVPPLVVRYLSHDQRFEVLDGSKRLSAAAAAGLTTIEVHELLDGVASGADGRTAMGQVGATDESFFHPSAAAPAPAAPARVPRRYLGYLGLLAAVTGVFLVHAVLQVPLWADISFPLPGPLASFGPLAGVAFWTAVCLIATANPIALPKGGTMTTANPVIVAAAVLGGPLAAIMVAAVGTLEVREVKRRIPATLILDNHLVFILPALAVAVVYERVRWLADQSPFLAFVMILGAALLFFSLNLLLWAAGTSLETGRSVRRLLLVDAREIYAAHFVLAPIAWLMVFVYAGAGFWAVLITAVPLFTTRLAHKRLVEMKETFISTIKALTHAMEARDSFTSGHSHRVSEVSIDIGKALELSEPDIELLGLAGILHDVGKIGVPDSVLMKPGRLSDEERNIIQAHPVLGSMIVGPIKMLRPGVPLIKHHHEWFDGSGYPDHLAGEAIPFLSRVLAVADSFDAMTSQRPYRMKPLTPAEAVVELRKGCGTQFDPVVVAAFEKTTWATFEDARKFVGEGENQADMSSAATRIARGLSTMSD